jgi:hypothetical protein
MVHTHTRTHTHTQQNHKPHTQQKEKVFCFALSPSYNTFGDILDRSFRLNIIRNVEMSRLFPFLFCILLYLGSGSYVPKWLAGYKSPNVSAIGKALGRKQYANAVHSIRAQRIRLENLFQNTYIMHADESIAKDSKLVDNLRFRLKLGWPTRNLFTSHSQHLLISHNATVCPNGSVYNSSLLLRPILLFEQWKKIGADLFNDAASKVSNALDEVHRLNISQWKNFALSKLTESFAVADDLYSEDNCEANSQSSDSAPCLDSSIDSEISGKMETLEITSKLIQFANEYHSLPDTYWQLVYDKGDITIWRCDHPSKPFGGISSWPSFKSRVIIDAAPATVADFFYNSTTSQKGNRCALLLILFCSELRYPLYSDILLAASIFTR